MAVSNVELRVDARNAISALQQVNRASGQTEQALNGIGSAASKLRTVFAGIGIVGLVQQTTRAAASFNDLQTRLKLLSSQYKEYNRAQEFALKSAAKFGQSNREALAGFTDIYARLKPLGVSLKDIETTYSGFNTVAKLSGVSAEGASAAFTQLAQALGSGRLQGDEFRSIGEQIPGLLAAVSLETGIATKDLKKFASDGKLTSDIIINALRRIETEGSGKIAALVQASDVQKFKNLQNAVDALSIAVGNQLLPILTPLIVDVTNLINAVAALPEPIKAGIAQLVKFTVEAILVKKAIQGIIALRTAFIAATTASTAAIAANGAAAATSSSAFALYANNSQALAAQSKAAAAQVTPLGNALRSIASIGIITVGINLIVNGLSNAIKANQEIAKLRGQRMAGGAAAMFGGAAPEEAKQAARQTLKAIEAERKRGIPLATRALGSLAGLVGQQTPADVMDRARLLAERELAAKATLALPTRAEMGGGGGGGGGSDKAAKASERAAKAAADEQARVEEVIRNRLAEGQITRLQSELKDKIAAAELAGDKQLAARLQGQQKELDIQFRYAQKLAEIKNTREQEAEIFLGLTELTANQRDTERELIDLQRQADQERLDSLKKFVEQQYQVNTSVKQQLDLADSIANTMGQGMTSAFNALITGAQGWEKSLQGIASGVLVDIANQLIRIFVIEQAVNAIKTFLAPAAFSYGATPLGAGGGSVGGVGTLGPNYGFPARAKGGSVMAGQPYLVGERGPELFMPGRSGGIAPTGSFGGGVNVVVNVDASGTNVQGNNSEANQLGRAVSAAVQAELIKQQRPGGLLSGTR